VHGMPDTIFNMITSPKLQVNALFVYRDHGECVEKNFTACFAHPGTYIGVEGISIGNKVEIRVASGSVYKGLTLHINAKKVEMGKQARHHKIHLNTFDDELSNEYVEVVSNRHIIISTPLLKLNLKNSDYFLNQEIELVDDSMKKMGEERYFLKDGQSYPTDSNSTIVQLHGLQGQTWRNAEYPSGLEYQGSIMDYAVADNNLFGTDFVFNLFKKQ